MHSRQLCHYPITLCRKLCYYTDIRCQFQRHYQDHQRCRSQVSIESSFAHCKVCARAQLVNNEPYCVNSPGLRHVFFGAEIKEGAVSRFVERRLNVNTTLHQSSPETHCVQSVRHNIFVFVEVHVCFCISLHLG